MSENNEKSIRKSYFCNSETNELVKDYSAKMGISESAFVNLCISNYHSQQVAFKTFSQLDDILLRLEQLEGKCVK
ncbi:MULTISPECIES: hypothetical protein [Bacteria]|jgi:hypothetical protein|uniref:CopG family transcriptional regulator n=1 Tax=Clostridium perfringens TaxID=1502 RepID=A0AAW9KMB6_CLOPF|nr:MULTISPECIES: hypothetical protein [Clostridium]MBI6013145.1 hypothetical protein [Clostridium perfringens]MDK0672353.1 hypothetical protein [Clostridium perfringens]MDK0761200.1 hypothetical protein [Clostridium perfringens]MDK0764152.1 hypothetical protein [Clostridium perfringens]MDM0450476.1 hypothetical protein [Clostridium perfringens]